MTKHAGPRYLVGCALLAMVSLPTFSWAATTKTPNNTLAQRDKAHRGYLQAMTEELQRNLKQFQSMKHPKVYHLRYHMQIARSINLQARDGQIVYQTDNRKAPSRRIKVDLRVGSHQFDNTGRDGRDWRIYRSLLPAGSYCPKELNAFSLKKLFWRLSERQYRLAAGTYWRKRYVRSTQPIVRDKAGDLSKEPPTIYLAPLTPRLSFDKAKWKRTLKRISALSKHTPQIISSSITLGAWERVRLGVGDDASMVRLRRWGYNWSMSISYLGKSKELLTLSDSGYARKPGELPTEKSLRKTYLGLWKQAREQLKAEEGDPDEGPAIVDPMLAGGIFYDILMVRLESQRFLRKRDQRIFARQIGQPIIPTFLSIIDNPLLSYWGKTPLSASYRFDDQWVPSQRLVMVKNGVLKRFYTSRKPYKQFKQSNGHGRGAFSYAPFSRPGVTIIKSKRAYSRKVLKQKLLKEIKRQGKRYGYILTRFQGSSQVSGSIYTVTPEQIYRLDSKTGELKRLKGLQVKTAALQLIRSIIATGKDYKVFNGSDSESSGSIQITTVAPSLLLKRVVFHRINLQEKKNYELPPPFKVSSLPLRIQSTTKKPTTCPKVCPAVCRCAVCK